MCVEGINSTAGLEGRPLYSGSCNLYAAKNEEDEICVCAKYTTWCFDVLKTNKVNTVQLRVQELSCESVQWETGEFWATSEPWKASEPWKMVNVVEIVNL